MTPNTVRNYPSRLPTRIKRLLSDALAQVELEAALLVEGATPKDKFEKDLNGMLKELEGIDSIRFESVKPNIARPLEFYKTSPRYKAFSQIRDINLESISDVSISDLHRPAVLPFRREWIDLGPHDTGNLDSGRVFPQSEIKGVKFWLKELKCFDETDEKVAWWWTEWGEDDIHMFVNPVDENGETNGSYRFFVGEFDDGDTKVYPGKGKELQYFNAHEGGDTFPKIYHIALSLLEHDSDSLAEWFKKVTDLVKEKVASVLASAVGAAVGSSLGPLGSLIGAAIGWALGEIIGMIHNWLKSEHVGTATVGCTINGYSGAWAGSGADMSKIYTRDFKGARGHYRAYWTAELIR